MDPAELQLAERDLHRYNKKFDARADDYSPLLQPKRTKAGKIAVRQPKIPKKRKTWW